MKLTIGDYLLKRLKELNIKDVYGVPGDYNLLFLDHIEDMDGINWIGNCNELNASYAADGYARVNGISAIVTTFGVGELSAINGIAGAYAEDVPVVKIVGVPSMSIMSNSTRYVHHSLGDGQYFKFYNMYREVTIAQTLLTEINAKYEIDRVLRECYITKKPVYIALPFDIVDTEIEIDDSPLNLSLKTNKDTLSSFIEDVSKLMQNSRGQVVMADFEVDRYNLNLDARAFVRKTGLPVTTTSMGKTTVDEQCNNYIGIYNGSLSGRKVKEAIELSDIGFFLGVKLSDFTTGCFSFINHDITLIEIHPLYSKIGEKIYGNILMHDVLEGLLSTNLEFSNKIRFEKKEVKSFVPTKDTKVTQSRFFENLQNILKEEDILLAETGTAFSGATGICMPSNSKFIGQPLWASIGYTLPALLGSQMANKNRRNILVIGDGSFQLTCQEVSTMLRENLTPVIFLINNDGYTIEKLIHGPKRQYNEINMWRYEKLVDVFHLDSTKSLSFKVETEEELVNAINNAQENRDKLAFIEVIMDSKDAPNSLIKLGDLLSELNGY
ncbi:MAG: alpha-keto acid decarboxylase family protein [Sarcina sp.]